MPVTYRQFLSDAATYSKDMIFGTVATILGTDGELYLLETDPSNPQYPISGTINAQTAYDRNGVSTVPAYDTTTEANIRPLPVILSKDSADIEYGIGASNTETIRVALSSDSQVTIRNPEASATQVAFALNDNSAANITTGAYVELIASLSGDVTQIDVQDTGGRWLYLATGAPASETDILVIPPTGNGLIPFVASSGTRISVKAIDGTASAGYLGVNFYG